MHCCRKKPCRIAAAEMLEEVLLPAAKRHLAQINTQGSKAEQQWQRSRSAPRLHSADMATTCPAPRTKTGSAAACSGRRTFLPSGKGVTGGCAPARKPNLAPVLAGGAPQETGCARSPRRDRKRSTAEQQRFRQYFRLPSTFPKCSAHLGFLTVRAHDIRNHS